ncbi:hypothetical protein RhiirC2_719170 [Rhizophagus irregularis]|uniref:Uncharacterized protein n=1 Tax=Rhizophagus irregularis TaxID=588596 RepID=A0A2N1MFL9_9GLOM|nr:hypothetical protein RhiirC2_719170 [Rhizophagus irregularis]
MAARMLNDPFDGLFSQYISNKTCGHDENLRKFYLSMKLELRFRLLWDEIPVIFEVRFSGLLKTLDSVTTTFPSFFPEFGWITGYNYMQMDPNMVAANEPFITTQGDH